MSIGIGIIGSGIHGSRYARHILDDLPGLELRAICRRSRQGREQARQWNCRFYTDWREIVDDDRVEALIVAVTPDLNPAIAAACGRAGKALLLEKPLAVSAAEGEEALAAFHGSCDRPFTIAHTLRYNSVILALRRELSRAGQLHGFSANQRLERSTHPWLEDAAVAGGGVILHTAVHMFDALRFITGREVLKAEARAWHRYNPALEDLLCGRLELEDGLVGTVDASKVSPARAGRYEFYGDAGALQGEQIHGKLSFVHGASEETLPVEAPGPTIVPLLRDWANCLRGTGPNPIPAEEGLAALRVCDAVRRSASEGREVLL